MLLCRKAFGPYVFYGFWLAYTTYKKRVNRITLCMRACVHVSDRAGYFLQVVCSHLIQTYMIIA